MNITGVLSNHAAAHPVTAFVPPGPVVTKAAPILSDILAYVSAAKEHACSWRRVIYARFSVCPMESTKCMAPPPGNIKTCLTPRSAIYSHIKSDNFFFIISFSFRVLPACPPAFHRKRSASHIFRGIRTKE